MAESQKNDMLSENNSLVKVTPPNDVSQQRKEKRLSQ